MTRANGSFSRTLCGRPGDAPPVDPVATSPHRPAAEALAAHAAMLRRYLFTLGAAADRIEDLVQQVFVLALEKDLEDRGPAALGSWLRTAGKHLLLRERRSASARREVELGDEVWREECGDDGADLVEALRECLRRLPPRGRALVQATYGDGFGRLAAGAAVGLAADGVKTALRRVRAALKRCVRDRIGYLR